MYHQNEPQVYEYRTDGLPEDCWLYKLARNTKSSDQAMTDGRIFINN